MSLRDVSTESLYQQLVFYIERDRHSQAEPIVSEILKREPNNTTALYYAAYLKYSMDENEEAEEVLKQALQLDPEDADLRFLMARTLNEIGRHAASERMILGLLREYPKSADYYAFYSFLMLVTLNTDKAARLAEEALRLDGSQMQASIVSVFSDVIKGKGASADEKMKALLRDHPESEPVVFSLVNMLIEEGRLRQAHRVARDLVWNNPSDEDYVEMVRDLRVRTHPTMLPLLPFTRYGWIASAVLWFAAVVSIRLTYAYFSNTTAAVVAMGWLTYVAYSWIYPRVLDKVLR